VSGSGSGIPENSHPCFSRFLVDWKKIEYPQINMLQY
jgi:hypothetical protein